MNPCIDRIIQACEIDALGVVHVDEMLTLDAYYHFIQSDLPEGLQYLSRHAACRRSFEALLPGTQSVICVACHLPSAMHGWARFCTIGDYHQVLRERLTRLEEALRQMGIIHGNTRICVDSAPILERELAVRAGLGWISYNHQLVHPEYGAGIVLGELLLTDDVSSVASELCRHTMIFHPSSLVPGSRCVCRVKRCCESFCPTGALVNGAYHVERCLAYLTTQHTGTLKEEYALAMGSCVWGCDACQKHCPVAKYEETSALLEPYSTLTPECVLKSSAKQLTRLLQGTPMAAAHPRILQRNYCYVLGNQHESRYSELLQEVANTNPCAWVRDAALRGIKK